MVRVNGGSPTSTTLKYGYGNVSGYGDCASISQPNDNPWGLICIEDTQAPHYGGWAYSVADYCSESDSDLTAQVCTPDLLFSLLVR